ncbi:MAG: hypothetical protein HY701_07095 [Gemmatimonadetes bacterium]|nr:hypothetical protein [Gemmatimonadota bacterium]
MLGPATVGFVLVMVWRLIGPSLGSVLQWWAMPQAKWQLVVALVVAYLLTVTVTTRVVMLRETPRLVE